ncbi:hypothetical protein G9A89_019772 [Geosiphon pyriformis]|nr:hypothetical protein G9A89_019772 [Geosiphon pyriformis]
MKIVYIRLLWKSVVVYLDNTNVFSKIFDNHLQAELKLNTNKYFFGKTELKFLGHVVSKDGVMGWSNKLTDSKGEQYCMVMEINKEGITIRK